MGQFGFTDYAPASASTLASDTPNGAVTVSTSYQIARTLTITPGSQQYPLLTNVAIETNANTILSVTITPGYSTQVTGQSESSIDDIGNGTAEGSSSTNCTTQTSYASESETSNVPGMVGTVLTVRFYMKTSSSGNTTAMCCRNVIATGKLVRRVNQQMDGQFRGSF